MFKKSDPGKRIYKDRYRGLCACGYVTFVDSTDAIHLQVRKWHARAVKRNRVIYAAVRGQDKQVLRLHRVILSEPNSDIDHKDHDGLNNRRANLRPCSRVQNAGNGRYRLGAS